MSKAAEVYLENHTMKIEARNKMVYVTFSTDKFGLWENCLTTVMLLLEHNLAFTMYVTFSTFANAQLCYKLSSWKTHLHVCNRLYTLWSKAMVIYLLH